MSGIEAERVAHYDAHREEVEAWPEVPAPAAATPVKSRGVVMSARFTMDEADAIGVAAEARNLTLSAYLRSVALEAAGAAPPAIDPGRIADDLQGIVDELRLVTTSPGRPRRQV